ncbi:MAG: DegV family protein, partial [Firmicutes bacterium]|nr:DegV family protein [Bacillota bacterium]
MSDYIITCCSTADLPQSYFDEHHIPYVCFHYTMNGQEYPDDLGKTIPFDKFYKMIEEGAMPTTSQVNVDQYQAFWEPFLKEGKDIIHLALSSGISGSVNSARLAAENMQELYPERRLVVIDSLAASSGFGLLVAEAAERKENGASMDEVISWVEDNKLYLHHWFFSTDLTSYIRGGRVSKTSGFFGTILKICPLLNVNDEGKLIPRFKIRTKKKVIEEIVRQMELHAQDGFDYSGRVFMCQSACYEDARAVADLVEARFPKMKGKVMINNIGGVIG